MFPFRAATEFSTLIPQFHSALASVRPSEVTLSEVSQFKTSYSSSVFLKADPTDFFSEIQQRLLEVVPNCSDMCEGFAPQVVLGQARRAPDLATLHTHAAEHITLPMRFPVAHVALLWRPSESGPFQIGALIPLGGAPMSTQPPEEWAPLFAPPPPPPWPRHGRQHRRPSPSPPAPAPAPTSVDPPATAAAIAAAAAAAAAAPRPAAAATASPAPEIATTSAPGPVRPELLPYFGPAAHGYLTGQFESPLFRQARQTPQQMQQQQQRYQEWRTFLVRHQQEAERAAALKKN
ncbi:hypothetical protein PAPYR_5217 [Paratrimastix pyriformis]|uniref:Uncharacterized protein n=1 Tax=Paratrimastix pyriformis TaxID=342808 RepID=A0ABQ8UI76_9EUKA|nr:hypothetical protein PAPYR_5217 [Paratrimastix pyriformis]